MSTHLGIHHLGTGNVRTYILCQLIKQMLRHFIGYVKTLTCWWQCKNGEGIIPVIRIHPIGNMNVCTKCSSNSCDISVWTKVVDQAINRPPSLEVCSYTSPFYITGQSNYNLRLNHPFTHRWWRYCHSWYWPAIGRNLGFSVLLKDTWL